jgi:hypothetical protein
MPPGGWWSREAWRLHLTLLFALPGCLAAGWFELTRAMNGREIAWAYAFEWPLFGVLGTYVWWRLVHDAGPTKRGDTISQQASDPRDTPGESSSTQLPADPDLKAWQHYLEDLQTLDPPGKPPWQR